MSERELFEEWALRTICHSESDLEQKRLGGYSSQELNYLWRGWNTRAALAAAPAQPVAEPALDAETIARRFHELYERLAPNFNYQTRQQTRRFDPLSDNGKLMTAVCAELRASIASRGQAPAGVPEDAARHMFDAGWKAAALFCDREDVVADGIIGECGCPQFETAFIAAQGDSNGK